MKTRILFVCLGNICRSPAAEEIFRTAIAREALTDRIETDSAGTYSGHVGDLPDPRMRRAAARRGYNLTHRARPLREADFERFDRIVVMDDNNYETVHRFVLVRLEDADAVSAAMHDRGISLRQFDRQLIRISVAPEETLNRVLDLLEDACEGLLEEIKNPSRP